MTIRQLNEILELDSKNFDSTIEYKAEIVAIYKDISTEEVLDEMSVIELEQVYNKIRLILNYKTTYEEEIEYKGFKFKLIPFTKLTLGEYIDLEYFIGQTNGVTSIIPILYRQFEKGDELTEDKYEKYDSWLDIRREFFLDIHIDKVLGVKDYYQSYREKLHNSYKGLFSSQEGNDDDESSIEEDKKFTISEYANKKKEEQQQAFSWESVILKLCNNNVADYDKILNTPVIFIFNILSSIKINNE